MGVGPAADAAAGVVGAVRECGVAATVTVISRLAPEVTVVHEATGDYVRDGDAHGYPRYRLVAPAAGPRFLFRSDKGRWSITGSEDNVARSKGTIVSAGAGESPVGLGYRYYAGNSKWPKDPSLVVLGTTPPGACEEEEKEEPDLPGDGDVDLE